MASTAMGSKAVQFFLPKLTKPRKWSTKTHETPEFTVGEYLKYRECAENKLVVI